MKIYIAAAYPEREAAAGWGKRLQEAGLVVTSAWIWKGEDDNDPNEKARYAQQDIGDILRADALLLRTGYKGERALSGGRHVEFGYALAKGKSVYVVGPRESVFHYLPDVRQYDTFEMFLEQIGAAFGKI